MPSALRFRVPVQGAGIGPHQENGIEWSHVYNLAADANGATTWSRQKNYTGFTHDTEYLMKLRNRGSGGRMLWAQKSTDGSTVLTLTDAGLNLATALTSTVATGTAPFVVASTTKVANLNADLLDDQSGTFYLARGNHTGTQTPATISPQGSGSGLDADLLDGHDTSFFATAASLSAYVQKAGDTMTGLLTMEPGSSNDSILKLKNSASSGAFTLGVTAAADPALVLKDNSGDLIATFSPSGATYALTMTGDLSVNDVVASGSVSAQGLSSSSGLTLSGPSNIDGNGGTAGQIRIGAVIVGAASLDGSEELLVNGQSKLKGDVTITTGTFRHESSGNARIEANSTGLGFFGATPIGRPAVTGSRGGNAALQSLCDQLADLGLISDLTT